MNHNTQKIQELLDFMGDLYINKETTISDPKYRPITLSGKESNKRKKHTRGICKNIIITELRFPKFEDGDIQINITVTESTSCSKKEDTQNIGYREGIWSQKGNDNIVKITHVKFLKQCRMSCVGGEDVSKHTNTYTTGEVVDGIWEDRDLPLLRNTITTLFADDIGFSNYKLNCCSEVKGTPKPKINKAAPTITSNNKNNKRKNSKNECPDSFVLGSCCHQNSGVRVCEDNVDCEYCKWKKGIWNNGRSCEERIAVKDSLCCKTCIKGKNKKGIKGNIKFRSRATEENSIQFPHMMYDPKTGKGYRANTTEDHLRMKNMGYTHEQTTPAATPTPSPRRTTPSPRRTTPSPRTTSAPRTTPISPRTSRDGGSGSGY